MTRSIIDYIEKEYTDALKWHLIKNYTNKELISLLDLFDSNDLDLFCFFHWSESSYYFMPLEEIPLYINDRNPDVRDISNWRLKIGK